MKITAALKREMETDIKRCNEHTERNGSMSLYNDLVAKYVVLDSDFEKGLSVMGKATVAGREFDFRPELKAIANKLHMWIVLYSDSDEKQNTVKMKVDELIKQGEVIQKEEYHAASGGFPFSYVSGPKYDMWMAEVNVLNERYLKFHPAYESINIFYKQRSNKPNVFEEMMAQLRAVSADKEFWLTLNSEVSYENIKMEPVVTGKNKIFIVHGHDESAKQTVARFLEQCGFEAVILHEQADGGRTIIEKIECYTDVVFAIILYTPCDIGRAKEEKKGKARARQNVVFEHGYLIGKLGRNRVCALVKDGVETPGDISGVVYKNMDSAGAWKTGILKEMKDIGIAVDASKLL